MSQMLAQGPDDRRAALERLRAAPDGHRQDTGERRRPGASSG